MDIDPSLTATKLRSRRRYSSDDSSQSSDDHPHEYALSPAEHAYKSLYPRFRARSSIPSSIGDWEGVFSDSDSGEEQAPPTKKLKLSESKKSSFHEAESTKPSRSAKKSSSSSGDGNPSKQALNGVTSISKPCDQCSSSTDEADRAPSNAVQASSLNSDAHARSLVELERLYSSQQKSVAALSSQMAEILLQIQTMGQQLVTLINDRHRKDTDSSSSEDEAPRSKGKRHRLKEPDNDPNVRNMGLEKLYDVYFKEPIRREFLMRKPTKIQVCDFIQATWASSPLVSNESRKKKETIDAAEMEVFWEKTSTMLKNVRTSWMKHVLSELQKRLDDRLRAGVTENQVPSMSLARSATFLISTLDSFIVVRGPRAGLSEALSASKEEQKMALEKWRNYPSDLLKSVKDALYPNPVPLSVARLLSDKLFEERETEDW